MDNENKNNEENVTTINIPGVIVPEQQTENGQVIKSNNVVNNPTVNNVSNPTSTTNNVVSNPVENTEKVNSTTNLEVNTSPVTSLSSERVVDAPKKSKNTIYIVIIVLLVAISGVLGYFLFSEYQNKVDPVEAWQKKRNLNKNSLVASTLFQYVNLTGCYEQIRFFYDDTEKVTLADLDSATLNYLAYLQLKYSDIETKNCSSYQSALNQSDADIVWYCGDVNSSDVNSSTKVILEDNLEKQVTKMFGEGSYKAESFSIGNGIRYLYDSKTSSYILQSYNDNGSSCEVFSNTLSFVYQEGDNLTLTVKVKDKNKKIRMFYYTFVESDDGNYYFSSLSKRVVDK